MSRYADNPITYLITQGEVSDNNFGIAGGELLKIVRFAVENGVSMVQIREKGLSARLLCELAAKAVAITRHTETKLLINDRADIALAAGADGVHLAANSLPADVVRRTFPADFLIGVSIHSVEAAMEAAASGADFAAFAPVFVTPDKREPQGIDRLRAVCAAVEPFPVLALGGVDEGNFADVLAAGASGFAAIRAMNDTESLKRMMRRLA